jgi:molecular chaperone GrpE
MENNKSQLINEEENLDLSNPENTSELVNEDTKQNYLEDLQRLQAEFENFMKRTEIEKQELFVCSIEKLVFKLLSVLDSFESALKHNNEKSDDGMKLMYSELFSVLESVGLSKIETEGIYDPNFHEVLIQEEGEIDNQIIEEIQSGYMLNKKVIRPAKVKIGMKTK